MTQPYPIGTPGVAWGTAEKQQWFAQQRIQRRYAQDVLAQLEELPRGFEPLCYGQLPAEHGGHKLYAIRSQNTESKPTALITGGVHGYETSGVHGALKFLHESASRYADHFQLIIAPCVSPWGYETINRWNADAIDPNRSFYPDSPAAESRLLMEFLQALDLDIQVHVDLHETTDTDNSEFRPALSARDAKEQKVWNIPDGYYLVADSEKPADAFQKHIITAVEQVTHIAQADESGRIIGEKLQQSGVIEYAAKELGLCMGFSNAPYVTTTEMYPDSPRTNAERCNTAQAVSIQAALDFLIEVRA